MHRIDRVRTHVISAPEYPHGGWVLVRLTTEEGVEGIGECFVPDQEGSSLHAAADLVDRLFVEIAGADVLSPATVWENAYELCRRLYDRRGLALHALSGIDMAVHDAAARTLGVPVHRLLGGCCRDRVRVYVSSIWIDVDDPAPALELTARYAGEGFTAIKYYGWPEFGSDPRGDTRLLNSLRAHAGDDVDLMLDLGRPASLSAALQMGRLIESSDAGIYWWEEPLSSSDDADNLAQLTARTDVTIAAGEAEITAFAFRDLITRRVVDLVQPDLSWVGGLTEGRRIAEMARLHGVPLVPHNWGMAVNTAASVHLVAAMPAGFLCEYPITPRTWQPGAPTVPSPVMTELVKNPVEIEAGYAHVPQTPGLGIELDEEALARHTIDN